MINLGEIIMINDFGDVKEDTTSDDYIADIDDNLKVLPDDEIKKVEPLSDDEETILRKTLEEDPKFQKFLPTPSVHQTPTQAKIDSLHAKKAFIKEHGVPDILPTLPEDIEITPTGEIKRSN